MNVGWQEESSPLTHLTWPKYPFTLVSEWGNSDLKNQKSPDKWSKAHHGRIFIVIPFLSPEAPTSIIPSSAQGSLLRGWDCFIFWLAGHVTISNQSVPFSSSPTWHSPWWSLQLCTPRIFSYQRADQSEKSQGRHTECSVTCGPWPSQAERVPPDPVLPRMLHPWTLKQISQEGHGLAGDLYGHIRFK